MRKIMDNDELQTLMADARQKQITAAVAAVLGAEPKLEDTTIVTEYLLGSPVVVRDYGSTYGIHVTRVRVSTTTWPGSETEPYVNVQGWSLPATKSGAPDARGTRAWRYLPDELAEALVRRGS